MLGNIIIIIIIIIKAVHQMKNNICVCVCVCVCVCKYYRVKPFHVIQLNVRLWNVAFNTRFPEFLKYFS